MRAKPFFISALAIVAVTLIRVVPARLEAQGSGASLTGVVSSQEEGKMEGVLVTARREGATFSVSVVSDAQGQYSFPRSHLEPGKYTLAMRATPERSSCRCLSPSVARLRQSPAEGRVGSFRRSRDR